MSCGVICQGCQAVCESSTQCYACETCQGCQDVCESVVCEHCQGCQTTCESTCQTSCLTGCQSTCERACQASCQRACQTSVQSNKPPTVSSGISVPSSVRGGTTFNITWNAASDPNGNLAGYALERSIDNGTYAEIYRGTALTFTDTASTTWTSVRYRVRAYDTYTVYSGYTTSNYVTIVQNVPPTISGQDENLGIIMKGFRKTYTLDDADSGDTLNTVETLNGAVRASKQNLEKGYQYTLEITDEQLMEHQLGANNILELTLSDSKGNSIKRRIQYIRGNSVPVVEVEQADYGEQNEPFEFKFKATDADNDAMTAKVFYNNVQLEDLGSIEANTLIGFTPNNLDFAKVSNGQHRFTIEVTDANGAKGYGYIPFTRNLTYGYYRLRKEVSAMPLGIIVIPLWELAEGAVGTVRVCNNALDESPTWEEVTDLESEYTFTNNSKTAASWALGVEVRVDRESAVKQSYIYGLVGAYK